MNTPHERLTRTTFSLPLGEVHALVGGAVNARPLLGTFLFDANYRRRSKAGYAAERGMSEEAALEEGLKQKATEFTKTGSKIYAKA